jgi:PAS domain S-box-containing protein
VTARTYILAIIFFVTLVFTASLAVFYNMIGDALHQATDSVVGDTLAAQQKLILYVGASGVTAILVGGLSISYFFVVRLHKQIDSMKENYQNLTKNGLEDGSDFKKLMLFGGDLFEGKSVPENAAEDNRVFTQLLNDYVGSFATPMLLVDSQGLVMYVNDEVVALLGYEREKIEGRSLDVFLSEEGVPVVGLWDFAGGDPEAAIADGEQFDAWHVEGNVISVSVKLKAINYGDIGGYLCTLTDMSERNELERKYEHLNKDLKSQVEDRTFELLAAAEEAEQASFGLERETRRIQLLQRISQASDDAYSTDESLHVCIAHICHYTQWPVGCVYVVDESTQRMMPTELWYVSNVQRYQRFKDHLSKISYAKGEGLTGEVYEKGKAIWIENFFAEGSDKFEFILSMGFVGAIALPIMVDEKVVAVFEFFATDSYEFDESVQGLMETISFQVSRIMERKASAENLQEALEEAKAANESKSEFLANMSHELRTPMHSIISFSDISLRKIDKVDTEKVKEYLRLINESGRRMLRLINGLLDLSKLEAGKRVFDMVESDIWDLTKKVLSEFGGQVSEKKININLDERKESAIVELDKDCIMQVVRNLVSNAVKFTAENGNITIGFELEAISVNTGDKEFLRFWVEDEGIGIPEDELEGVFDKFIQSSLTNTGAGGTGLGLSICREIISAHHGKIWAENVQDDKGNNIGAKLLFEIPVRQAY